MSAWYVSDILLGIKVITVGIKAKTERKTRKKASFHRVYSNGEDIDNKAMIKRKQNMLYVFNCYGEKYNGTVNKECSGEQLGLQFYIGWLGKSLIVFEQELEVKN